MDSLYKIENLMYLCGSCHYAFDSRVPTWVFLPANLDFFITQEMNFQSQRSVAAGLGLTLSRPNPCTGVPTHLPGPNPCTRVPSLIYRRYQIRSGFLNNNIFLTRALRFWHGNPITAILRSASILVAVQRLDPITQGGLPEDVARKFHHLMFLYSASPPALITQFAPADTGDIADSHSASGKSSSLYDGDDMGFAPWTHPILPHNGAESTASLLNNNQALDDQPPWAFGPDMTSGTLIEWNMDALEIQAGVDAKIRDGGDDM